MSLNILKERGCFFIAAVLFSKIASFKIVLTIHLSITFGFEQVVESYFSFPSGFRKKVCTVSKVIIVLIVTHH